MTKLFHIPNCVIDTSKFNHLLHGEIVTQFERAIADYVGAEHAVSFNSATSAIQLLFSSERNMTVKVPSVIPPVVCNAIINSGNKVEFVDNIEWVGHAYTLHRFSDCHVIDSAQEIKCNQFADTAQWGDAMIFSFFPTKPIGSCDGGMIVSNDKSLIDDLRISSMNGMSIGANSWERKLEFVGHKMYMNSLQAHMAMESFRALDEKKYRLAEVREKYNTAFKLNNTSEHLYRINVLDNALFITDAAMNGIQCGIHYDTCHDKHQIFGTKEVRLPKSEAAARSTVSIPYHESLTEKEIETVINFVYERL